MVSTLTDDWLEISYWWFITGKCSDRWLAIGKCTVRWLATIVKLADRWLAIGKCTGSWLAVGKYTNRRLAKDKLLMIHYW